jgi:hypothetical protein
MMGRYKLLAVSAIALSAALAATTANANVVTGIGWEVSQTIASNAIPGNVPQPGAPSVTFAAPSNPLSFNSNGTTDYTLGSFLATGGATGVTFHNGAAAGDTLNGTIFEFTGTVSVTTGETFTAGHDDGMTLTIGGVTVISAPGPTAFTLSTSTYTGPSGNQPFQLVYGECCGAPGVLNVDLPLTSVIPEPSTWAMMMAGFAGLGLAAFRRSRKGAISVVSS